jgi:hypothetical protein
MTIDIDDSDSATWRVILNLIESHLVDSKPLLYVS